MRGHVPGLETPHPLGHMLPGVYQGDEFAQRFTSGLDEVLAPVVSTLDNLPAYFDPRTAPPDFLDFLSAWLGIEFEQSWELGHRRQVLLNAVALHRRRGTASGVREAVSLVLGAPVEVLENGAAAWSQVPGSPLPGRPAPELVVRIGLPEMSPLDRRRIDALVAAVKPAHVPHRLEWGADLGPVAGDAPPGSPPADPGSGPLRAIPPIRSVSSPPVQPTPELAGIVEPGQIQRPPAHVADGAGEVPPGSEGASDQPSGSGEAPEAIDQTGPIESPEAGSPTEGAP